MNQIGTQTIDTERCLLRRIVPDDAPMMYENWAKLEEVCRYFPFNPVTDIEIYKEKVHKWANNYESNTYGDLKDESSITLVSLYPELKADTLVENRLRFIQKITQKSKI